MNHALGLVVPQCIVAGRISKSTCGMIRFHIAEVQVVNKRRTNIGVAFLDLVEACEERNLHRRYRDRSFRNC